MNITIQNETLSNLLADLQLENYQPSENLETLLAAESKFIKDLKINTGNVLFNTQQLSKKEALLMAYGIAVNEKATDLKTAFSELASQEGASPAELAEVVACASLMATNNVFYRFRHFMSKEYYNSTPAGIKMSIMMNPVLGKEYFELLSLAISSVNGCEMCVKSHEQSVLSHGASEARVYESVKLAAIIKGLINVLS
jgi:alkyl hydroperoxide reductase subunit D